MYDYGQGSDPVIGRWNVVDPLPEAVKFGRLIVTDTIVFFVLLIMMVCWEVHILIKRGML